MLRNSKNYLKNNFASKRNFCQVNKKASKNVFSYLNERDLISNISNEELKNENYNLNSLLGENARLYIGFDPTAESLHLGNLVGILNAVRFSAFGIEPVLLLGGATGQIGDPSGKNKERPLLQKEVIDRNLENISNSFSSLFTNMKACADVKNFLKEINNKENTKYNSNFSLPMNSRIETNYNTHSMNYSTINTENTKINYKVINNLDFYKDLNVIDFLRNAGCNLRMGSLLSRETVKNRINSKDGLSLTEFMYQAFQGYDYLKLFENFNVRIQIGGSDQWGNMLAGYELIKKIKNTEVVNMTFPLLTTADGCKFGKSEGNALFLNPILTPINSIYQYFYNSSDADLKKLLYAFTFLDKKEIDNLLKIHSLSPEKRIGQKTLAEKLVGLLFSEEEAKKCTRNVEVHYCNFNNINKPEEIDNMLESCQAKEIPDYSFLNVTLSKFCCDKEIFQSKAQFRRALQAGSIQINDKSIKEDTILTNEFLLNQKYMILKTGKKHTHVFHILKESDDSQQSSKETSDSDSESVQLKPSLLAI